MTCAVVAISAGAHVHFVVLTLTAPGVPMLFQGQEFLEDGWFSDTDPLDWSKREIHEQIWETTRALIALRKNVDGKTRGLTGPHVNVFRTDESAKVLAWHRWAAGGPDDNVVVAADVRGDRPAWVKLSFPHCGSWAVRAAVADAESSSLEPGNTVFAGPEPMDGLACSGWVELPPYGALVLSRER